MRFSELFSAFGSTWPEEVVNTSWPPTADVGGLLAQIDDGVRLHDVATDIAPDGTVSVTAKLKLATTGGPAETPLVSRLFPSFRFLFKPELDWESDFRCAVASDGTASVQIDSLPLDVEVPPDLLAEHPDPDKQGADTGITLSDGAGNSVISRSFALTLEASGELRLDPHLPISIGPCKLVGIPMLGVHELVLIGSRSRAYKLHQWIVRPLDAVGFPMNTGGLGFGGIEVDWEAEASPLAKLREALNIDESAELVIEDVVLPAMFLPPFPKHGTIGLRRTLEPGESLEHHLSFEDAPLKIPLGESATLFFDQLYFTTPPEDDPVSDGLSLEAGIAVEFGSDDDEQWDFSLGLIDGDLVRLSIARTPPAPDADGLPIINLDLWEITLDVIRARFGVAVSELQKDEVDAGNAIQALGDILIRERPDSDSEPVNVETEDGQPLDMAIVDVGWDRGEVSGSIEKAQGVQLKMGPFALELHELGLLTEEGATYINISGGIRQKTDPFEGRVWFERLRGKLVGNPDAPGFKLGGFGATLEVKDTVEIEVHGHFRNEVLPDGTRIKEHGLGGKITIHVGEAEWGLSLDVYWGERVPVSEPSVDYLLFQAVLFGAIPAGPIEFRSIEALYADDLLPRIEDEDREAGELVYYPWLRKSRPTALAQDRGLSAWRPENGAWAFGAGLSVSFTGCGEVCLASAFALGFDSEEAAGLIVVLELKLFGSEKPIAIGILEYDFRRDAFVIQIKVDLKLQDIIENFPDELKVKLGGQITIGNKPGLVAFGRIGDQSTWIGASIELELSDIAELKIRIAVCFEWLEAEYVGGGFVFSLKVRGDLAVIQLEGWGSLLVLLRFMLSGTNDFVARIAFEMGFRLVLLGFLRFGIAMNLLADWLAHTPNFFVFRATFRLETPWFLPDVSVTVECTQGTLEPASRGMVTGPLLEASAESQVGSRRLRLLRIDGREGSEQPELHSLVSLPDSGTTWRGEAEPVPLDGTIEIQFSPMLVDGLGLGVTNPDFGTQTTGDGGVEIHARYELIGLEVRRRPLGGTDWEVVETITSPSDSRRGRWAWDLDTRTGGEAAPKKLIYNGATPFTVAQENPVADAEILNENPAFPCCTVREPDVARLDFCDEAPGATPAGFVRRLVFLRRGTPAPVRAIGGPCSLRPPIQPGSRCDLVASFLVGGLILSIAAEEDMACVALRFSVVARVLRLRMVARSRDGTVVDRVDQTVGGNRPFETVEIDPGAGFRSLDIYLDRHEKQDDPESERLFQTVELEWVECVMQTDRDQAEADRARCDRVDDEGHGERAPFLAQHEYEIAITTRIGIRHTDTDFETRTVTERAAFLTAGLPGLNETPEPGLELRPYVISHDAGGRGLLYREESVHLVLSSDMTIFGPGPGGDDEAGFRFPVTLTVATEFDTRPESSPSRASFESDEWFLANRAEPGYLVAAPILALVAALTGDPLRRRYQSLSEASSGTCPPDDVWNEDRPRLGVEPFDPSGRSLWLPRAAYHAAMRPEGGPVVNRAPFEVGDITTFLTTSGSWSVEEGMLVTESPASGRFGEPEWDLFTLEATGDVEAPGSLGAAVLVDGDNPGGGLRVSLAVAAGRAGTLQIAPLTGGAALASQDIAGVPTTVSLRVEVFADAIRATAAGVSLSVAREGRGPGICEISGASLRLRRLRVRALEMYGFDFTTSRYESFEEHIATAEGAGALEISGAAESLFALVSRLAGEITAAMRPEASDAERERLFSEAAQALAVPLREEPRRLHLEVVRNGADRWLLLESPEPIDLVSEVTVRVRRRVPVPPGDAGLFDRIRDAARDLFPDLGRLEPRSASMPPRGTLPPIPPPWSSPRPAVPVPLPSFDQARRGRRGPGAGAPPQMRDETLLGRFGRAALGTREQGLAALAPGAAPPVFSLRLVGDRFLLTTVDTEEVTMIPAITLAPAERDGLANTVLMLDPLGRTVDWLRDDDEIEWHEVGLVAIQNANATQLLLMPRDSGALPQGHYRVDFEIDRPWFETTEPAGPSNSYRRSATHFFDIL